VFRRCNLFDLELADERAHDGVGDIKARRIATHGDVAPSCHFIDYVELPPGTTVGDHRHGPAEEEYYLVLAGTGTMRLDEETFDVSAGDLVRNGPGGVHGLRNTGDDVMRVFIFELEHEAGQAR
jgi:quercetin dioxygenase-like cupin family protein